MECFNLKLAKIIYICAAIKWWRWKKKEEQGEAFTGILKEATASAAATQVQGRKKTRILRSHVNFLTNSMQATVYFRVIDTYE